MASESTKMVRLESFPFDSKSDGYDADGYPVYDRAVGATMLRETFAKFFSNGVFPSPGDALQISKAGSGLVVNIAPGIAIINGAMGGVLGSDPISITLDDAPPQGNVCYGIMVRFDNTSSFDDSRSLLFNVVRSDASSVPSPPTPDTTTPGVYELRLGYVTVPNGATDLGSATVTNEKGLTYCPYAAPFEEIDMSEVTADARASANEALTKFLGIVDQYLELLKSAVDGTTAGDLQNQITELQQQIEDFDLSNSVDDETIEYSLRGGEVESKLRVKEEGINTEHIADSAITTEKIAGGAVIQESLDAALAIELGLSADISGWDFQQCLEYVQGADQQGQAQFLTQLTSEKFNGWTVQQCVQFCNEMIGSANQKKAVRLFAMDSHTWPQAKEYVDALNSSCKTQAIGMQKSVASSSGGPFPARIIGISADTMTAGGKASITWQSTKIVAQQQMAASSSSGYTDYSSSPMRTYLNNTFKESLPQELKDILKQVNKASSDWDGSGSESTQDYCFIIGAKEVNLPRISLDGSKQTAYEYWASASNSDRVMDAFNLSKVWWTRDKSSGGGSANAGSYHGVNDGGSATSYPAYGNYGVVPCFCI